MEGKMMGVPDNQFRKLLRVHVSILTVTQAINELYDQYKEMGYRIHLKLPSSFSYYIDDRNIVLVYWEEGMIYEKLSKYKLFEKNDREEHGVGGRINKAVV
jgi:hypothetical protein